MRSIPEGSVQTCVTSPPYFGLRDYGVAGQLGLEPSPDAFVAAMVEVFREVRRVLADDGTLWLNLGDSYGATKQLIGIPWRVALALQADGWYLRQDIIWHKPNPMPESVRDRCTKAHEYIFMLSKSPKYFFNSDAIKEPSIWYGKDARSDKGNIRYEGKRTIDTSGKNGQQGFATVTEFRNKRSVWTVTTKPFKGAHFATFPPDLIEPCILAGSRSGDTVLDPFGGSGTTGGVALKHGRKAVLCELNPEYATLVPKRIAHIAGEGWDLL
jgi:site-specific DNA-methyltransferase (adenine-specific)